MEIVYAGDFLLKKITNKFINFMLGEINWRIHRARVWFTIAVILIILCLLGMYSINKERNVILANEELNTQRLSNIVISSNDDMFKSLDQILEILAKTPEVNGNDSNACNSFLKEFYDQYSPKYSNLGVADIEGNVICNSSPLTKPINIKDRSYFQKILKTKDFAIGDFMIGEISGKPMLGIGSPVLDKNGAVIKIVFLGLDMSTYSQKLSQYNFPSTLAARIINHNGNIAASNSQLLLAKPLGNLLYNTVLTQRRGSIKSSDDDKSTRFYNFSPLIEHYDSNLFLVLDFNENDIIRDINPILANRQIAIALQIVLSLALLYAVIFLVIFQFKIINKK